MKKLNYKTDIQVVNLIEREVTKSEPSYITPQHPCIFPYDLFFQSYVPFQNSGNHSTHHANCAIPLETGLGESRGEQAAMNRMKLLKGRWKPQKADENGVTNLICPLHYSAYDQSGFTEPNVIYANYLNANLF